MRSSASWALCLLTLATPIIASPIPTRLDTATTTNLDECTKYASCRPSYQVLTALFSNALVAAKSGISNANLVASTPHFPSHQLSFPTTTTITGQAVLPPPPPSIAKLELIPSELSEETTLADDEGQVASESSPLPAAPTSSIHGLRADDAVRFGYAAVAGRPQEAVQRFKVPCHKGRFNGLFRHQVNEVGFKTVKKTYTYTYTYVRKDYADILVVGIVLAFLLAVVLVEMMDNLTETARQVLGLPGAIRLEEEDDALPACVETEKRSEPPRKCTCGAYEESGV